MTFIFSHSYCYMQHSYQLEYLQTSIFIHFPFQICAFALVSRQEITIQFVALTSHVLAFSESKPTQCSDKLSQEGQVQSVPPAAMKRTLLLICTIHKRKLMIPRQVYFEIEATKSDPRRLWSFWRSRSQLRSFRVGTAQSWLTCPHVNSQSPRKHLNVDLFFRCPY